MLLTGLVIHAAVPAGSAVVIVDASGITASPAVGGVTNMHFAVAGPNGQLLFAERSDGTPIRWSLPAGALDGLYTYEVRITAGAQELREAGRVRVAGGVLLASTLREWRFRKRLLPPTLSLDFGLKQLLFNWAAVRGLSSTASLRTLMASRASPRWAPICR